MHYEKDITASGFWTLLYSISMAQDDSTATETKVPAKKFIKATFNSTRIINMQSVEIVSPKSLQFMVSHHFGYFWNKDLWTGDKGNQFQQNLAHLFGLMQELHKLIFHSTSPPLSGLMLVLLLPAVPYLKDGQNSEYFVSKLEPEELHYPLAGFHKPIFMQEKNYRMKLPTTGGPTFINCSWPANSLTSFLYNLCQH